MKANSMKVKALSMVLAASIVSPSILSASPYITKEETVYVILDNDGKVNNKLSSIWIHSDSALNEVVDKSRLNNIVNIKGDTEPTKDSDNLIWNVKDSDIYYQGNPDEDLPIATSIKYYLDNEEVDPEHITGKSGKLKIEIEVANVDKQSVKMKNNKTKDVYTPYIVATVVDLPTDKFSNIDINTGKLISDGSRQLVSHISLPGVKESLGIDKELKSIEDKLEITADVVDFEMESIMFAVTSEFPDIDGIDSAKDLDDLIGGLDKIEEASDKLVEATEKLAEGQRELDIGIGKLVEGANALSLGSNDLLDGSNKLKDGINSAYEGSRQINQGANTLASSAGELGKGFSDLGEGAVEFSNKAIEFSGATSQLVKGLGSIPSSTKDLQKGMGDLITSAQTIQNGQDNLTNGLNKSADALKGIKASIPNPTKELMAALEQVEKGLLEAKEASSELSNGTKSLNDGQNKINGGLGELANGTSDLNDAANQLSKASSGLQDGANKLSSNAKAAKSGASQFSTGAKNLSDATKGLSSGLGELKDGSGQLNQGITQLNQGSKDLANGGKELKEGSNQLVDGTNELNKGMRQFTDEGINKISEELDGSNLNIADIIKTKDELVKLSKENNSFSGMSEDMEGNLKFIMKTESIKKDKFVEEDIEEVAEEAVETAQESKGFIKWIKGIFS